MAAIPSSSLTARFREALAACERGAPCETPAFPTTNPQVIPSIPPTVQQQQPFADVGTVRKSVSFSGHPVVIQDNVVASPEPNKSTSWIRTVAIIVGIALLAIGGLYARKHYIAPFIAKLRQKKPEDSSSPMPCSGGVGLPAFARGKVRFVDQVPAAAGSTNLLKRSPNAAAAVHQRLAGGRRRRAPPPPPPEELYPSEEEDDSMRRPPLFRKGSPSAVVGDEEDDPNFEEL